MSTLKSVADGASEERRLWIRKVKELQRKTMPTSVAGMAYTILGELLKYGHGRTKRNNAKAGGLGKKAK